MIAVHLSQTKFEPIQTNDPTLLRHLHFLANGETHGVPFFPRCLSKSNRPFSEGWKTGRTMDNEAFWNRLRDARGH